MRRDDVAQLLVASLQEPCVADITFEVRSTVPVAETWTPPAEQSVSRDWGELLRSAGLKPAVTGRTVDGVYTGKQPDPQHSQALAAAKQAQPVAS